MGEHQALAISVPGFEGRFCEDASQVGEHGDAVVLADGLGSAQLGSLGSHTVVNLVLGPFRDAFLSGWENERLRNLFFHLWNTATHGAPEVATTCLFAIANNERVLLGQVGDGLVLVVAREGSAIRLPTGRGPFGNETHALPGGALYLMELPLSQVRAVLLCTDGVADDLVPGTEDRLALAFEAMALAKGVDNLRVSIESWLENWPTPASRDDRSLGLLLPFYPTESP